ncbi:hypothetical protein [Halorientalis halophila]|uniref:hypothetical protein n=1 Tax=Halorientalis halophila TaxID=3108499 RepID=UPI0030099D69
MTAPLAETCWTWYRTAVSSLPDPAVHAASLGVRTGRFLVDVPALSTLYLATGVLTAVAATYLSPLELLVAEFCLACPVLAVTYLTMADWTGAAPQTPVGFVQGTVVGSVVVAVPLLPIALGAVTLSALLRGDVASVVPGVQTTGHLELYLVPLYPLLIYLLVSSTLVVPATVIDRARPTFAGRLGWRAVKTARWTVVGALFWAGALAMALLGALVAVFALLTWLSQGTGPTLNYPFARRVSYEVCKWLFAVALGFLYVDRRPV